MNKASVTKIKICGITNEKDAKEAVRLGADALGFNFYKKSPRCITADRAQKIIRELPPFVKKVGVFVNSNLREIEQTIKKANLDLVQLHGDEQLSNFKPILNQIIKVIHADKEGKKDKYLKKIKAILIDSPHQGNYGGTGKTFDWALVNRYKSFGKVIILSGGLSVDNVEEAIDKVKPYAVDACSCLEMKPGKKDLKKIREFISRVREADKKNEKK